MDKMKTDAHEQLTTDNADWKDHLVVIIHSIRDLPGHNRRDAARD